MTTTTTTTTEPAFLIRIGFAWHRARSMTLEAAKIEAAAMQSPVFTVWCPAEVYDYAVVYGGNIAPLATKKSARSAWVDA